jgi:aspartyl-tRNA(Asn)/glutamyl-tRNA(Gln) amidotransferase subunit A
MTLAELAHRLSTQKITSRQLVEEALAAIKDRRGEGARAFLMVHESEALAAADRVDAQCRGRLRKRFIRTINTAVSGYDAMLMPTTRDTAPTIAEATKDDESYFRLNDRMILMIGHVVEKVVRQR